MGYSPWGPKELDMTEHVCAHTGLYYYIHRKKHRVSMVWSLLDFRHPSGVLEPLPWIRGGREPLYYPA